MEEMTCVIVLVLYMCVGRLKELIYGVFLPVKRRVLGSEI